MKARKKKDATFGKFLRFHRRRIEMSAEKLGYLAGLDGPRITRMEHGQLWAPPLPVIRKMAQILGFKKNSQEWQEFERLGVANRLKMSGLDESFLSSCKTVRIHVGIEDIVETHQQKYTRIKENPAKVWTLEEAARRATRNIESDKARVMSARLLVRASNKREWEYDVLLPCRR